MSDAAERITSLQNDRVKRLVKLRTRRTRRDLGVTLLEESLVIERALAAGRAPLAVWFCPEQLGDRGHAVLRRLSGGGVPLVEAAPHVMEKVSYRGTPSGLIVEIETTRLGLDDLDLPDDALVVVLENVEKPGNLGAVLRVADGAGADAVLVTGSGTDLDNPNTLRASRGTVFSVPTVEADAADVVAFLGRRGIATLATTPDTDDSYSDADLRGPTALLFGAEDRGLTGAMLAAADRQVAIPMLGIADSLNVATSVALVLYEARRQRSL